MGTVISSTPDRDNDPFLAIKVKPAADLNRLEEVLVITKMAEDIPRPARARADARRGHPFGEIAQRSQAGPKCPKDSG